MKRTVNHTGRQRIELERLQSKPKMAGVEKRLELSWDLGGLGLEGSDEIIAEVSSLGSVQRYVLGTVGSTSNSGEVRISNDVTGGTVGLIFFTVETKGSIRKITATTSEMPIIFQSSPSGKSTLMNVELVDDLKTLWRVDYSTKSPILQICNRDSSYSNLSSQKVFLHAIIPEVIKDVAFSLLTELNEIDEENAEKWYKFFAPLGLTADERETFESWTEDDIPEKFGQALILAANMAEEFSIKNGLVQKAIAELGVNQDDF